MLLINSLEKIKKSLKSIFCFSLNKHIYHCRIEKIDLNKKNVFIYCIGTTSLIKLSFEEALFDTVLLASLPPKQASWIGYHYGKLYNQPIKHNNLLYKNEFSFRKSEKRFTLISQNRNGNISYLDRMTNEVITGSVLEILTTDILIDKFESLEASYLGILGGILASKYKQKIVNRLAVRSALKLVK
jgi:hypothetical protein